MSKARRPARAALTVPAVLVAMEMAIVTVAGASGGADAQVTFTDIAAGDNAGISYRRAPSLSQVENEALQQAQLYRFGVEVLDSPDSPRGMPGVAMLDYDRDGDLDLYVTNGPGADNSLYSNQYVEHCCSGGSCDTTCPVEFIDMADAASVTATAQDSNGACFGDIDNDGDHDLLVLGNVTPENLEHNRVYENDGDGTFTDISAASGLSATTTQLALCGDQDLDNDGEPDNDVDCLTPSSCAFGDVDNDGLLDVAIVQAFDMRDREPLLAIPFSSSQRNQLFLNQGGNTFSDVSATSGVTLTDYPAPPAGSTFPAPPADAAAISWAVSLVDYDSDGDVDIFVADDQGAIPYGKNFGVDRGYVQLYQNDGSGHFTNVTIASNLDAPGDWMGLSFGDFDGNGLLDVFSSNVGMPPSTVFFGPPDPFWDAVNLSEQRDSRWFLQQPDGVFIDTAEQGPNGDPNLYNTPFGWGTSGADYDNDGDTDIIFHGGFDFSVFVGTAPGVMLRNDGSADFRRDTVALAGSTDHVRRNVRGMAVGDLNNDGFVDIASVSNFDYPDPIALTPTRQPGVDFAPFLASPLGTQFDADAFYVATFMPLNPFVPLFLSDHVFNGIVFPNGTLSVEMNSADNRNRWAQVEVRGTKGLTTGGTVNRDGIGAVLTFKPRGKTSVMQPILGGSSMTSQDSLIATFGLGRKRAGWVEVLWPGGVRNKLSGVRAGERVLFPEIPCSFDDPSFTFATYDQCVVDALDELRAGPEPVIDARSAARLWASALFAFFTH